MSKTRRFSIVPRSSIKHSTSTTTTGSILMKKTIFTLIDILIVIAIITTL